MTELTVEHELLRLPLLVTASGIVSDPLVLLTMVLIVLLAKLA